MLNANVSKLFLPIFNFLTMAIFQVFGGILMGCINGKSPLTEEDMNYIARNTAMEKDAVEVIPAGATDYHSFGLWHQICTLWGGL